MGNKNGKQGGKLRVGVIGAGMISGSHLEAYKKDARVETVWVADVVKEKAVARANEYGVPKAVADYASVLKEVDAVSVCTPPFAHLKPVLDAARAGVHVLCEKPMSLASAESRQMVDACAKAKVKLGIASSRSTLKSDVQAARDLVAKGKLGKVYYSRATTLRRRGRPGLDFWPDVTWFLDSKKAGGGSIMDIGCYDIDILLTILGEPQPVSVSAISAREIGSQRVPKGVIHDTDEHMSYFVRFKNGSAAHFETSWAANMDGGDTVIFGTEGGIRLNPLTFFGETNGTTHDAKLNIGKWSQSPQEDFVSACVGKKAEPDTPGTMGLKVTQIIEAALKSAKEGKEIRID